MNILSLKLNFMITWLLFLRSHSCTRQGIEICDLQWIKGKVKSADEPEWPIRPELITVSAV